MDPRTALRTFFRNGERIPKMIPYAGDLSSHRVSCLKIPALERPSPSEPWRMALNGRPQAPGSQRTLLGFQPTPLKGISGTSDSPASVGIL